MKIERGKCPVCGYAEFDPVDEIGCTTYEICPSCGCQSGYTYGAEEEEEHLAEVRRHWFIAEEGRWWSKSHTPPIGWNAGDQLKSAGIVIPE